MENGNLGFERGSWTSFGVFNHFSKTVVEISVFKYNLYRLKLVKFQKMYVRKGEGFTMNGSH